MVLVIFCPCAMILLRGLRNRIKWSKFVMQMLPWGEGRESCRHLWSQRKSPSLSWGALHGYPHSKSIPGEMAGASRIGAFLGFLLLELLVINVARWISWFAMASWGHAHDGENVVCVCRKTMYSLRRSSITGTETVVKNCSSFQASSFWLIRELRGFFLPPQDHGW